jgi:hypothetical protein
VCHKLSPEQLRDLLTDFRARRDLGLAAKKNMSAAEFAEEIEEALTEAGLKSLDQDGPDLRGLRDYVAIAHRYQCECAARYDFPHFDRSIADKMTRSEQDLAFGESGYVEYVMSRASPACRWVKLACERNLNDLARSYAAE